MSIVLRNNQYALEEGTSLFLLQIWLNKGVNQPAGCQRKGNHQAKKFHTTHHSWREKAIISESTQQSIKKSYYIFLKRVFSGTEMKKVENIIYRKKQGGEESSLKITGTGKPNACGSCISLAQLTYLLQPQLNQLLRG